jgi:hypothetical protein
MKKKGRMAKLTPAEDRAWVDAFNHAKDALKYGDLRADAYAAREVCKQFPRLKGYSKFAP